MKHNTNAKGFTAIELMLALVILSLGLMPVFGMMTAGTRQSHFSEYSLFASARAHRIIETFTTFDYRHFESMGDEADLDISKAIFGEDPPLPAEYLAKLDRDGYSETASWKTLDNGLGVITVVIEWTFPADAEGRGGKPHTFTLKRFISQPDLSFSTDLEWAGGSVS